MARIKRTHRIIPGLLKILEKISRLDGVKSVIPGKINRARTGEKIHIKYMYELSNSNGVKLLAKGDDAVQEVFVYTDNTDEVQKFIKEIV